MNWKEILRNLREPLRVLADLAALVGVALAIYALFFVH